MLVFYFNSLSLLSFTRETKKILSISLGRGASQKIVPSSKQNGVEGAAVRYQKKYERDRGANFRLSMERRHGRCVSVGGPRTN